MAKALTRVVYRTRKVRSSRRNGVGKMKVPLAVVAGLMPGVANVWAHRNDDPSKLQGMAAAASRVFLGYASTNKYGYNDTIGFHPYLLSYGTGPLLAGFAVHWIANKVGINRALSRIPFLSI